MYAIIFDEQIQDDFEPAILSLHASRKDAERALGKRRDRKGKSAFDCRARIIWTDIAYELGDRISRWDKIARLDVP